MQANLVSIITPAFNAEKTLESTIVSVVSQSFENWEMLIVDDGSADRTREIASYWAGRDRRIRLIESSGGLGCSGARNLALREAKGRYLAFLDSDDLWLPGKLQEQLAALQSSGAGLCFSGFYCLSEDGSRMGPLVPVPETLTYSELLKHNVVGTLTVMIDQEQTGPLQMADAPRDDYIQWLSLLQKGVGAVGIPKGLALYRLRKGSVSSNKLWAAKGVWRLYRESQGLSFMGALWCFTNYFVRASLKHARYYRPHKALSPTRLQIHRFATDQAVAQAKKKAMSAAELERQADRASRTAGPK